MRPRLTPWWERQVKRHDKLWNRFTGRPEVQGLAQDAVDVYARAWLMTDQHEGDLWMDDPEARAVLDEYEYDLRIDLLTDLARTLEPDLARFYGDELRDAVHRHLAGVVARHFDGAEGVDRRVQHLPPLHIHALPGTDIRLGADGFSGGPTNDSRAISQLQELQQSYEPARQRGRPKSSADHLTDDEARRAWEMHSAGRSWQDIAEAVDGSRPNKMTDLKYEAVQRRIYRLVERGQKLSASDK